MIDFIGPLPLDQGFNSIVMFTDRLGSKVCLVLTKTTLNAEELTNLFFQEWYCENGLPLEIILDCDKLFTSRF